ncbi:Uncharacterized protein FWK35_00021537 [Aphis craccivora]|uniref:Uncharacterized protein n=1 Tax=Aphis craccivora TaxID=307492 RepID=A0A6G0VZ51_APHCR|nr:Uncharacterized protein FWK35_00021537 [Aphis craccivora]
MRRLPAVPPEKKLGKVNLYECTDSWNKLDITSLPRKEDFYRTLIESGIKEEDFKNAKAVCKRLGVNSDLRVYL